MPSFDAHHLESIIWCRSIDRDLPHMGVQVLLGIAEFADELDVGVCCRGEGSKLWARDLRERAWRTGKGAKRRHDDGMELEPRELLLVVFPSVRFPIDTGQKQRERSGPLMKKLE
jgi:hypothetical protein